jgi:hypothetical protein
VNIEDYLKVVGDYADQIAQAEQVKDKDSLVPAMAMADFFESAAWVEVGLELVPLPKNPKSNRALRPDTIERFHKVNNALLERDGRNGRFTARQSTTQFIRAGQAARYIPKSSRAAFRTERQVRPLVALMNAGYAARIPEAVNLALEEGAPTFDNVQRAARLVKHNADKGRTGPSPHKIDRLRGKRVKAELAVLEFLDLAQKSGDTGRESVMEFKQFLKTEFQSRRR